MINWYALENRNCVYAMTCKRINGKNIYRHMHRLIMKAPKGVMVDHINGNGLDNRRCNLRLCTNAQNQMNSKKKKGKNKYFGVHPHGKKFQAMITLNGKNIGLGSYETEEIAAKVYNQAALKNFGDFARLNLIDGSTP